MTTEIAEYSKTEAALADLAQKYKGVIFDMATREGMGTAIKGRAELRTYRLDLEKERKRIKEPALRKAQLIDSEARRITSELVALEDPIDAQIKREEERKELERTKAAREMQEKLDAEERARKEAEEARMAEERAALAKAQAEFQAKQAAQVEADRKARAALEAEQRAARLKIEVEERAARVAREEADRVARQAREAEEAAQRAILREQAELADGMDMLQLFVQRFGKRPEFSFVVTAINKYLRKS